MKGEKNDGSAMSLGLSERQKFDAKKQGNTAGDTGIPDKKKSEKVGKHTIK